MSFSSSSCILAFGGYMITIHSLHLTFLYMFVAISYVFVLWVPLKGQSKKVQWIFITCGTRLQEDVHVGMGTNFEYRVWARLLLDITHFGKSMQCSISVKTFQIVE